MDNDQGTNLPLCAQCLPPPAGWWPCQGDPLATGAGWQREQEWAGGSGPKRVLLGKAFSTWLPLACQQGPMEGAELRKEEGWGSSALPALPDLGLSHGVSWYLGLSIQPCLSAKVASAGKLSTGNQCASDGWVRWCSLWDVALETG